MNITKILFSVMAAIMIVTNTNATTMCVTNNNTNIILDPSIEGTEYTRDEDAKTWTVTFPHSTVSGIARCTDQSGARGVATPSYNPDNYPIGQTVTNDAYVHCWCRMTSPVRSAWVYDRVRSSASDCVWNCAGGCGYNMQTISAFRGGVFGSAGM